MEKMLIHYSEIGLKGKNRNFFEKILTENIRKSFKKSEITIKSISKNHNFILCDIDGQKEKIDLALKSVFGIEYFCYVLEIKKCIEKIEEECRKIMEKMKLEGHLKISFKTKRSDKNFPFKSIEINEKLGEIANSLGLKVDYKGASKKIYLEINRDGCYIYLEKIKGYSGLPVGSSGRVLCLLSGGIDSPISAWQMMKRGCRVDFLHVHNFKTNKEVHEKKITEIAEILNKYQFSSKLYLVPYSVYEFFTMDKTLKDDLVLFRHYLFKLAEKIASEKGYQAIITGDNLGQVASQTLENLNAGSYGISLPIFRPLLTFNKQEIINISEEIGTYEKSIEDYKDCCSILAKNPKTKTNLDVFKKILENFDMDKLIEKSIKEMNEFEVD